MSDIWVISDTHLNHANILKFTDKDGEKFRGDLFRNVHEMNEVMIERWNSVVKPQDKVYHLGDVYFGSGQEAWNLLKRLNGKKRLVLGNHDDPQQKPIYEYFKKISVWRHFKEFGLLLTHVPVHLSALKRGMKGEGYLLNVHGHIHQNKSPEGPYRCVCVEQINYTPINIEELRVK